MPSLYAQPLVYRMLFDAIDVDVPFYRALGERFASTRPTLECGVGAGRMALAFARAGLSLHGVDVDASMLADLRRRLDAEPGELRARVSCEEADVRTMRLERRFPLVISPFNSLAHQLSLGELRAFFQGVRAHLEDDGVFAFDLWIPDPNTLRGAVADSPRFLDPRTGVPTRCTERKTYDPFTQVLTVDLELRHVDLEDGDAGEHLSLRLRQIFPEEARLLVESCGFEVLHRTSRFSTFVEGAPQLEDEAEDERGDMIAWVCRPSQRR